MNAPNVSGGMQRTEKRKKGMRYLRPTFSLSVLVTMLCVLSGGCTSTRSDMTPGKMEWIQPHSDASRAGNAYLFRGWIGVFSGGMDKLTEKIDGSGVRAHVFQEDQHNEFNKVIVERYRNVPEHEPIVLVGHSLGADDAIAAARALDEVGVQVDLLITIDATMPKRVPKNVKVCYNYYQPSMWDYLGVLRGIPLQTEPGFKGQLHNMNVRKEYKHLLEKDTNHVNIDKNTKIHADVIAKMMPVCPPRAQWAAMRNSGYILAGSTTTRPSTPETAPVGQVTKAQALSSAPPAR
jgi:hypothetical protein